MRNIKNIKIRSNKVFKSFVSIGLALSLVLGTASVSFAEGDASAMNTETAETSVLSVEDKINDMYSNIENEIIRKMYLDATKYYLLSDSNRTIYTSPKTIEAYECPSFSTMAIMTRDDYVEYIDYYVYTKDETYIAENTAGINLLYDLCQIVKNNTVGMTEEQKMQYLMSFVSSYMRYNFDYMTTAKNRQITPTFFQKLLTKSGVCIDFAQFFTILGRYIGLNTSVIRGTYKGEGHAWCSVTINGARYTIEPIHGIFTWDMPAGYVEIERREDLSTCEGLW